MAEPQHPQMPVCGHDQIVYIREMVEWHEWMANRSEPGDRYHWERARSFQKLLENPVESLDTQYY
ncbi:hypothetical protein MJA45_19695 [Paenibacillus aurantius]|uniref:Uncharacterized protein n=1 Tax=Paenibacillus aurantius TaxID=2918900 RepID=A0AA96L9X2_9BACL|nr:hypothetical protein [Paenibacillus aurantius]WJH34615.1 hypothetical protein N6H14_33480 [Paenibacillus sp. CC-CFT747]WNQ09834.1 hypothetical protein MJA45_19695 [Paenibacillus aurantius]